MPEYQMIVQKAIVHLVGKQDLSRDEARGVMDAIMNGGATPAQIGSIVTALRMKGETIDEITGFAETMRSKAERVETVTEGLLDTCGTGGDGANTFNISTTAAIVAAAGGIKVAKHGNRAMSSRSGSADVLEALGVNIALTPQQAKLCLDRVGLCFMFAPMYHQSMKHAAAPRKELGVRTIFNVLGPLTNPAGADRQLMGVFDKALTSPLASVLRELGLKRAMVVASRDGLDEISLSAPTQISELKNGDIRTYEMDPDELGLSRYPMAEVAGGDAQENAAIIHAVLDGEPGARRDIVLANAGACFYLSGRCSTLQEGVKTAAAMIDSGAAKHKLEELVNLMGEMDDHVS